MKKFLPIKSLRAYTDDELSDALEDNENMTSLVLAGICSEILRRALKRERDFNKKCLEKHCEIDERAPCLQDEETQKMIKESGDLMKESDELIQRIKDSDEFMKNVQKKHD